MRTLPLFALFALLTACNQDPRYRHDESAREAGRQAYRTSQDIKRGARHAEEDIRNASREFREGWDQARRDSERHRQSGADRREREHEPDR